jgi:hypothetical protein
LMLFNDYYINGFYLGTGVLQTTRKGRTIIRDGVY